MTPESVGTEVSLTRKYRQRTRSILTIRVCLGKNLLFSIGEPLFAGRRSVIGHAVHFLWNRPKMHGRSGPNVYSNVALTCAPAASLTLFARHSRRSGGLPLDPFPLPCRWPGSSGWVERRPSGRKFWNFVKRCRLFYLRSFKHGLWTYSSFASSARSN